MICLAHKVGLDLIISEYAPRYNAEWSESTRRFLHCLSGDSVAAPSKVTLAGRWQAIIEEYKRGPRI
jgi:hypothetical protein